MCMCVGGARSKAEGKKDREKGSIGDRGLPTPSLNPSEAPATRANVCVRVCSCVLPPLSYAGLLMSRRVTSGPEQGKAKTQK